MSLLKRLPGDLTVFTRLDTSLRLRQVHSHHLRLPFTFAYMKLLTAPVILWSEFVATDSEFRVQFPELPDFMRSSGPGTGSTHPREYNRGAT
jgi:hypothetical protein